MVRKNDVFNIFKIFQLLVERQFDTKIKQVQSDWGGEFRFLSTFFKSIGIHHRTSCPHTSEQNGTIERRHSHVVDTGLSLLAQASLPLKYWHFAFETTVYLINCMPTRVLNNDSPYYCLFQTQPNYHFLKFSGCLCFMYLRPYNTHKMSFRSVQYIFLGYSPTYHGYWCLDPKSNRIYIARHVRFNENNFPFSKSILPKLIYLSCGVMQWLTR